MALVSVEEYGRNGASHTASIVEPDETLYDVIRSLSASRATGLPCLDEQLPSGALGPSQLVVLRGETACAKSVLLCNVLLTYVAPALVGGYELPAVLIDAEGTFSAASFALLVEAFIDHPEVATCGQQEDVSIATLVEEALSRLLVLRPKEPVELLRQLRWLHKLLSANPETSLLVVDSMSAWQPLANAFPRSIVPLVRECWHALERLQRQHCLGIVVAQREFAADSNRHNATAAATACISNCYYMSVARKAGRTFTVCAQAQKQSRESSAFTISSKGEVVSLVDAMKE